MLKIVVRLVPWLGVLVVIAAELRPVLGRWRDHVVGPFGGADAQLQTSLLEWTRRHAAGGDAWYDLPIFHPVTGTLAYMDSLLGQALLVAPAHLFGDPSLATQYNLGYLLTLVLAVDAMAALWMAGGGRSRDAGIAAIAFIGSPYALAQLGNFNQMPMPMLLFALAALVMALSGEHRRRWAGTGFWWLFALCLFLQAAWGWYGFGYAVVAAPVMVALHLVSVGRNGSPRAALDRAGVILRRAAVPLVLALAGVLWLAQPQLRMARAQPEFQRTVDEVRFYSADIKHVFNGGAYRVRAADLAGRGPTGPERYVDRDPQVMHMGWIALALAIYGLARRRHLSERQLRTGMWLLAAGAVGYVLAFGDSLGVPGTSWRLPLPLEWLRTLVPPFKAFRIAWRFSLLMVLAVAWWAAVGWMLLRLPGPAWRGAALKIAVAALLVAESLPHALPAADVPFDGAARPVPGLAAGPLLTVPAPVLEVQEDGTETLWLAWAMETGRTVTGGATGWVPPEIRELRLALAACEAGEADAGALLAARRAAGYAGVVVIQRPGDDERVGFWRQALADAGARRIAAPGREGYDIYGWP